MAKNMNDYPQGEWIVQDKIFTNKYDALLYGTKINSPVILNYYNSVWDNFDRSLLGKYKLDDLYKKRAQQLRDKYDYLILYFSGGSDSYNVLRSFLDNGIKLDEVCVKWCTDVFDGSRNAYTPNTEDKSAYNYLSEWDYSIKPVLDWISENYPEVKINVINWLTDEFVKNPNKFFDSVNHWHDIEIPSLMVWSDSEEKMILENKTVGSIYGVDKPYVTEADGKYYTYFTDACLAMGPVNPINPTGTEYFYWSHTMPELPFEMAYQIYVAQQTNEELKNCAFTDQVQDSAEVQEKYQIQQKIYRGVLYSNWIDSFQTFKPERLDRSDKHSWIYKDERLKEYRETYHKIMNERLDNINPMFVKTVTDITDGSTTRMYSLIKTRNFPLLGDNYP